MFGLFGLLQSFLIDRRQCIHATHITRLKFKEITLQLDFLVLINFERHTLVFAQTRLVPLYYDLTFDSLNEVALVSYLQAENCCPLFVFFSIQQKRNYFWSFSESIWIDCDCQCVAIESILLSFLFLFCFQLCCHIRPISRVPDTMPIDPADKFLVIALTSASHASVNN